MSETVEMHDCKEIKKLKDLLELSGIPNECVRRYGKTIKGYEIFYPNQKQPVCVIKEEIGSLGYDTDTLQYTSTFNEEEKKLGGITIGFTTAEETFTRIREHFQGN